MERRRRPGSWLGVGLIVAALAGGCGEDGGGGPTDGGAPVDEGVPDGGPLDPVEALCAEVEAALAETGTPGWAYAVIEDGEPLVTKASGTACVEDPGRALTTSTPLRTLSLNELFLALAALEAEVAGELDLDATVPSVLSSPSLTPVEWFEALTARDLVFHTDGLPTGINLTTAESIPGCDAAPGITVDAWVSSLDGLSMGAPPGRYQTRGMWSTPMLARVLEETDGAARTPAEIVQARLFEPLGMGSAGLGWADGGADGFACGHSLSGTRVDPVTGGACEAALQGHASIEDLARLAQVLANRGVGPSGERVLSESTTSTLFEGSDAPTWISSEVRASAGLSLWPSEAGPVAASAFGGFGWEIAFVVVPDRRFAVVVALNGHVAPGPVTPVFEVVRPFLQARLGIDGPEPPYRPTRTWNPADAELSEIAGSYRSVAGDVLELTPDGAGGVTGVLTQSGSPITFAAEPSLSDRFNATIGRRRPAVRLFRDDAGAPAAIWMWNVEHVLWRDPPGPPIP